MMEPSCGLCMWKAVPACKDKVEVCNNYINIDEIESRPKEKPKIKKKKKKTTITKKSFMPSPSTDCVKTANEGDLIGAKVETDPITGETKVIHILQPGKARG